MRMHPNLCPLKSAACAVLFSLSVGFSTASSANADTPADPQSTKQTGITLPPKDASKSIQDFLNRLRNTYKTRLTDDLAFVKSATEFDDTIAHLMAPATEQILEDTFQESISTLQTEIRKQLESNPSLDVADILNSLKQNEGRSLKLSPPDETPRWEKLLNEHLTPEQLDRLRLKNTQLQEALNRQLATIETQLRPIVTSGAMHILADVDRELELSEERFKLLEDAFEKALTSSIESCVNNAKHELLALPRAIREAKLKANNGVTLPKGDQVPERQAVWRNALEATLSQEEQQKLNNIGTTFLQRRTLVRIQLLLSIMSEKVAPSTLQRERIAPLIEKLIREQASAPDSNPFVVDGEIDIKRFLVFAAKIDGPALQQILDPIQFIRWFEATKVQPRPSRTSEKALKAIPARTPTVVPLSKEPDEQEGALSDFLFKTTERYRAEKKTAILLQVEDVTRISNLSEDVILRLKTAALGALEASMATWKATTERNTRMLAQRSNSEDLLQTLADMGDPIFNRNADAAPEKQPIWLNSLQSELSEEQRRLWNVATEERRQKQSEAIASLLLLNIDRTIGLRSDQHALLHGLLTRSIMNYGPDIADIFSGADASPWYFRGFTMYLPFHGIPAGRMQEILNKRQWTRWATSQSFELNNSNWENVLQRHTNRERQQLK